MGASGWSYYVKYQGNIKKALHDLRWEVFNQKEYYTPIFLNASDLKLEAFIPPDSSLTEEDIAYYRQEFERVKRLAELIPDSPDKLLQKCDLSGTHSIIDITEVVETEDLNKSGRLSKAALFRLFGTTMPTKKMVESKEMELQTYRGRWLCTYVIVYNNQQPYQLFFTGYSGD